MKLKYTKMLALAGLGISLFTICDNSPNAPFHGAQIPLRMIGGGILAAVAAGIGGAIGFVIDAASRNSRNDGQGSPSPTLAGGVTSPPATRPPATEDTREITPGPPRVPDVPPSQTPPLLERAPDNHPKQTMNTTEYEVIIPQGKVLNNGYVEMRHNTQYSLCLKNYRSVRCDAEVSIDGIHVGTWRIKERGEIQIDRPVHDTGRFTFFEVGTEEASAASIAKNSANGLISVTFKPQKERKSCEALFSAPASDYRAGATGLTGESDQQFINASEIDHDESRFYTIHIRLVTRRQDIRPLAPRATPVPPPVD